MRSIFGKILLWSFGTLVVSLVAFAFLSVVDSSRNTRRGAAFSHMRNIQLNEARTAFETGGARRLEAYLRNLNGIFQNEHYFTDASGKDLVSGEDRSGFLARARSSWGLPRSLGGRIFVVTASNDDLYRFIVAVRPPVDPWSFLPYYAMIVLVVGLLCYLLAVNMATPLRALGKTVEQFGNGDLAARVRSPRRDEIGDLSRAFDQMADRIQTLLTAERRLLQDISHELRSPLARLSFAAELTRTAEDRDAATTRLKKELHRLTHLVDSLLQVTRAEGDASFLNREEISLDQLLKDLVADCEIEADARLCEMVLQTNGRVVVHGDKELLRRAIENVLRNAIRYAPESTPIDVKLESSAHSAKISIRDFGPGVPEELLPELFKPFFRADKSRNGNSGGAGLGLAIAQRAITLHQGKVQAQNTNPGLVVSLELPV